MLLWTAFMISWKTFSLRRTKHTRPLTRFSLKCFVEENLKWKYLETKKDNARRNVHAFIKFSPNADWTFTTILNNTTLVNQRRKFRVVETNPERELRSPLRKTSQMLQFLRYWPRPSGKTKFIWQCEVYLLYSYRCLQVGCELKTLGRYWSLKRWVVMK